MSDFPVVPTGENVTRQVLSDHPDLMVVAFRFAASGAIGALHDHPHVQSTYVESGRFRFTLGDAEKEFGPGAYNALRGHGGLTAVVIQGGEIRLDDKVEVLATD